MMRTFIYLLLLLLFGQQKTLAQSEYNNLTSLLKAYMDAGEFREGLPIAEKAVIAARKEFGTNHPTYATSLNNLGFFYYRLGQYADADSFLTVSTALRKKLLGDNHPEYAISLNNLATLYGETGDYMKAEILQLQVIAIQKKLTGENHPDYALSLHNLAFIYEATGRYKNAESLYKSAMEIRKKVLGSESPEYAESMGMLSGLYRKLGQFEKAESLVIQSIAIRKKQLGEEHPYYATALNNLGYLYNEMGRYEKAEQLFKQSLLIAKTKMGEKSIQYATALENLGLLYTRTGQYDTAEYLLTQSLQLQKMLYGDANPENANGINILASLYLTMGQYEKAELLYKEALALEKKGNRENLPAYARALNNLGVLYLYQEEFSKAEPLLVQALEIRKKQFGVEHPDYLQGQSNLAGLYIDMGKYDKAETLLLETIPVTKKISGETHPNCAEMLNNLAALYYLNNNYSKAEKPLLESAEIRKKILGERHPDYIQSLYNLSLLYDKLGLYTKAEQYILKNSRAEMQNLTNIFSILSEKEKGNYLLNKTLLIESNNRHVFRYKRAAPLILQNNYDQQLFFKSVALSNTSNTINYIRKSNDSVTKNMFEAWRVNKAAIAKEYSLPIQSRSTGLKKLEDETENLEKELNRRSAGFRVNTQDLNIKSKDVYQSLRQEEAAIEFVSFSVDNRKWTDSVVYAAYLLRKNDSIPVFIPLCEEKQLQDLFDSAGTNTTSMVNSFYRGGEGKNKSSAKALGKKLYDLVWAPLEPYLKGVRTIHYSPAGKLYSIAFHALPMDDNKLLMDQYKLNQYTSTRQVALNVQGAKPGSPQSIILFGDASFSPDSSRIINAGNGEGNVSQLFSFQYRGTRSGSWSSLPGTADEVKKIQQLFEQNKVTANTYVQSAATEERLKGLSGHSPQILHIATHGFFLPAPDKKKSEFLGSNSNIYTIADDPLLRSGLILAGGNHAWSGKTPIEGIEDGIATAYEISQLNLSNTELVVLSACETALGDVRGSEGVFGLQRAFKMAGVKKMIVSLWQVPDKETAELMSAFYTYWLQGKTISEAFTLAQSDMRKKYAPYYWAAFVLIE